MASEGANIVDNLKTVSSTGTWNEQLEDILRLWALDSQKRATLHEAAAARFRFLRFWAFVPLITICLIMPLFSSEKVRASCRLARNPLPLRYRHTLCCLTLQTRWLEMYAFFAVAAGQGALYVLDFSGRSETHLNYAGRCMTAVTLALARRR